MTMQGVNYSANSANVNSNYSKQNTEANQHKKDEQKNKTEKYVIGALGALALAGSAALAIHKIKSGKKVSIPNPPSPPITPPSIPTGKAADTVAEHTPKIPITLINKPKPKKMTPDAAFKLADVSTGKKASDSAAVFARYGMFDVDDVAKEIGEQGKSISKPKKIMTKNLKKPKKEEIKEAMTAARNAGAVKTEKAQEALEKVDATLNNAINSQKRIFKQMDNAKTEQEINNALDKIEKKVIDRTIAASDALAEIKSDNPQVLEKMKALQAKVEQESEKASAFIDEANAKAQKMKEKIAQEAKEKAAQQSNPQVITNQEKQAISRLKNLRSRTKNKSLSESEFLQTIVNNPKENEATRKLAQSKLDKLAAKK